MGKGRYDRAGEWVGVGWLDVGQEGRGRMRISKEMVVGQEGGIRKEIDGTVAWGAVKL